MARTRNAVEPPAYAATSTPPSADTSLFRKADRFFGPSSSWTVQNSLYNADAGMPLAQDCPAELIDSTTGHYNSTRIRIVY